jgi:hypothetical protein
MKNMNFLKIDLETQSQELIYFFISYLIFFLISVKTCLLISLFTGTLKRIVTGEDNIILFLISIIIFYFLANLYFTHFLFTLNNNLNVI